MAIKVFDNLNLNQLAPSQLVLEQVANNTARDAIASPTNGYLVYVADSSTIQYRIAGAWRTLGRLDQIDAPTTSVNLNNQKIINLLDPTNPQDAATKQYVDNAISGIKGKESVKAATTANITLSGTQTIDGVSLIAGDRVLVKNQTTSSANGIYIVNASAWSRSTDTDTWNELVAAFVFVEQGTANADTGWLCSVDQGGTIGTTNVAWIQFSAAGQVTGANVGTGTGLVFKDKTGNTLNFKRIANGTYTTVTNGTNDITIDVDIAALQTTGNFTRRFVFTSSAGATTAITGQTFGSVNYQVQVYETATGELCLAQIVSGTRTATGFTMTFPSGTTAGQFTIIVQA